MDGKPRRQENMRGQLYRTKPMAGSSPVVNEENGAFFSLLSPVMENKSSRQEIPVHIVLLVIIYESSSSCYANAAGSHWSTRSQDVPNFYWRERERNLIAFSGFGPDGTSI